MNGWLKNDAFLVIGHRGAAGLEPENTLRSFAAAYKLGVGAVELDVHWKSPELLVIHDSAVDRTTNGHGELAELSLEQLRRLDAGKGQAIPTLKEMIAELPSNVALNIELKGPNTAEPVAELLKLHGSINALVSSFNHAELEQFRRLNNTTPIAPLFGRQETPKESMLEIAIRLKAYAVNMSAQLASRETIQLMLSKSFKVFVYTINDVRLARRLKADGASGVFTDLPDIVSTAAVA